MKGSSGNGASGRSQGLLFEVCVDSVESALEAQEGGAHRVELCGNLLEGGTTPSSGMIKVVKSMCKLPVYVLVRPRGGDFLYSDHEVEVMKEDIRAAGALAVEGVVLGILTQEGEIDVARMAPIVALCKRLQLDLTFHRAFDVTKNALASLEVLIEMGIPRVLTSGQRGSALEGVALIKQLVEKAQGRIKVMAGAGVSEVNAAEIVRRSGVNELHGSARVAMRSRMKFCPPNAPAMGRSLSLKGSEQEWLVTDRSKVQGILAAAEEATRQRRPSKS